MEHPIRFSLIAAGVVALVAAGIYAIGAPQDEPKPDVAQEKPKSMEQRPVQLSTSEAEAVKAFEQKLVEYAALRSELEANAEPLGEEATPEEIDKHRTALRAQIKTARVGAKVGDFFTPGMVALVMRVCATTTAGSDGQEVKSAIMDENPGKLPAVHINDRYPDGVPVATMPAELLEALPKLNEFMEYRFLDKRLVLVDAGAGVVLDITPDVLP